MCEDGMTLFWGSILFYHIFLFRVSVLAVFRGILYYNPSYHITPTNVTPQTNLLCGSHGHYNNIDFSYSSMSYCCTEYLVPNQGIIQDVREI